MTNQQVVERIRDLTGKQACHIAKALTQDIFSHMDSPPSFEEMAKEIEPLVSNAGIGLNVSAVEEWYAVEMESGISGATAKLLLEFLAADEEMEKAVEQAMERYVDMTLDLGIISAGVAIALVYVAISSDIDINLGWFKLRKKGLSGNQQKELAVKTLPGLAKAIGGKALSPR